MGKIITTFSDGSKLEYDKGAFDEWCVYLTRPNVTRYAPKDFQYFQRLANYGAKYGFDILYNDYVEIYNLTTKEIEETVLEKIKEITNKYGEDALNVAIDFTIIYMGMIAEENKKGTKLGKRIKRLGIYQVLKEQMHYNKAANFSKGKKWRELNDICLSKGF
ncbi:hypothetical protein [Parabacteroides sp. AM08-6]|uniref:DUF7004 family protein n=1 Tax=Parabacteroides sp. AM08-6 TaxID=2292053 RepID=UPI000F00FC02|nr:hypothetical protein [Parabacteroides sp. AM08-6]RHJ78127.1 hypothetical protein DW103_15495 [Parabacteroides sp. AM08-6]